MKIKFNNGSSINAIKSTDNVRGKRSKLISCICYDNQNNEFVFVEDLDYTKPFDRFIPEWLINQIIE